MKRNVWVLATLLFCFSSFGQSRKFSQSLLLMGTRFEFAAVHEDSLKAHNVLEEAIEEVRYIESVISSHKPGTLTHQINSMAGIRSVKVPFWFYHFIQRSKKVSALTDGAFDISYAVMDQLWDFKSHHGTVPNKDTVVYYQSLINYEDILLGADTSVMLRRKGMRIGFGAIGKGFAANRAKQVMLARGVKNGFVDASGDVLFWGNNEKGKVWQIGIASPMNKRNLLGWLEATNLAVVTSGNYESFILEDSVRYSHILDPKTGWPSEKINSATVVCPDAEIADALATALTVLGPEKGLKLINRLKGIECLIVTDENEILVSNNLHLNRSDRD